MAQRTNWIRLENMSRPSSLFLASGESIKRILLNTAILRDGGWWWVWCCEPANNDMGKKGSDDLSKKIPHFPPRICRRQNDINRRRTRGRRKAVTNNVTIDQSAFHPSKSAQPKQPAHLPYTNKCSSKSGVSPQECLARKLLLSVLATRHSHHLQHLQARIQRLFFLDMQR